MLGKMFSCQGDWRTHALPWLDSNQLSRQSTAKVPIARQSRDPKGIFQLCGYRMGITAYLTESEDNSD